MTRHLILVAGTPSADHLGADLMEGLAQIAGEDTQCHGIGGARMLAKGLRPVFPMEETSRAAPPVTVRDKRYLLRRMTDLADAVVAQNPAALITIDLPQVTLRLASKVKARARHLPILHYTSPIVWDWRPDRARRMARSIDHVLALFPFEPPLLQAEGMRCDFVGHPVVAEPRVGDDDIAVWRAEMGIAPGAPIILVLPGTQGHRIDKLAPIFGEALRPVLRALPTARVVVSAAPEVASVMAEKVKRWPGAPCILDPRGMASNVAARRRAAFAAADVALTASGSTSLELAASDTPMVVANDMTWPSGRAGASMSEVDTVTPVNLISDSHAVPELLGEACKPAAIAAVLTQLLTNDDARAAQLDAAARVMMRLGRGGEAPGLRAARSVMSVIQDRERHKRDA